MDDKELIRLIRNDTSIGIRKAIETYGKAVKTICTYILKGYPEEDVEEAISDSFVGLWKNIGRFDSERYGSLKSYIYGIARKTALNRRRELMKHKLTEDLDNIIIPADQNVEQDAIGEVYISIIKNSILNFSTPDKEIFIYRYLQEKSVKEIAELLSLTPKSVENRLARGKARLKNQLMEYEVIA